MTYRRALIALCLAVSPAALAAAPVAKQQLLVPPAGADHFVVISEAGKHGDEYRWTLPDGSVAYRESILLRGLVFEQDEVIRFDAAGKPVSVTIRGVTPSGDSAETFAIDQAIGRWKTPVDEGEGPAGQAMYLPYGGTFLANDAGISSFLRAGEGGLALLPSGRGRLEPSRTLSVTGPDGPKTIRLYFLKGVGQSPQPAWLDEKGKLFGFFGGLGLVPAGYEGNLKAIIAAQEEAIAELAPATAKKFLTADARQPILFRNVKIYDADKERFVAGQNVAVSNGKIVSVGTALPKLPAGARV
ncbi:MAG: amidohydrolase, partial [Sphingomicrobium sp.]